MKYRVAVIGGGPAGALCAYHLAGAGVEVVLFERDEGREKPCGGGLTPRAFAAVPQLHRLMLPWYEVFELNLVGPNGRRVKLDLPQPIRTISRRLLDNSLRRLAVSAGAHMVNEKVSRLKPRRNGGWQVNNLQADIAVGAGGINDPVTRALGLSWRRRQRSMTFGTLIPGRFAAQITCRFFSGLKGYAWWFPRSNGASLGIEFMSRPANMQRARLLLQRFASDNLPGIRFDDRYRFAWAEPMPGKRDLQRRPFCGKDWALVGDAAGLVDALTGEGLPYAMESGRLAADAIASGKLAQYPARLRTSVLPELAETYRLAGLYYHRPMINGYLKTVRCSRRQQRLLVDYALGNKAYRKTPAEIIRQMPGIGLELLVGFGRQIFRIGDS